MATLAFIVADGVIYASWLLIVAVGMTLVYGVMRILNVAHGSLYALGAYTAATMVGAWFQRGYAPLGSFALLLVAALVVGLVMGLILELGLLRFLHGRDEVVVVADSPRSGDEILRDALHAIADEIRRLLDEGVVADAKDVDTALLLGAGWPFWLGGITKHLDQTGVSERLFGRPLATAGVA